MTEYASKIIDIFKSNLPKENVSYKSNVHISPDITDKMINNAFRGLELPLIYDDILVIFDMSVFSSCKSGLVFIENGFFASRVLDTTYFVNYKDIEKCEIVKDNLIIHIANRDSLNVCYTAEQTEYLKKVLDKLADSSKTCVFTDDERNTGPLKKIKELISKNDLKKCQVCIHGAATACGAIGATPHIPLSDSILITPIQVGMLISLSQIFNEEMTKSMAQSLLMSFTSSMVGRNIAAVTVGWIPGIGNAVNLATAASMTELIGWTFVREFSQNKEFFIRKRVYDSVNYFYDVIDSLSDENLIRLAFDVDFISGKKTNGDRKCVSDEFFSVIAQYTFLYKADIKKIFSVYTKALKNILSKMESGIVNGSQAHKYYTKFQNMNFEAENMDFEKVSEFVELFLGMYNSLIQNNTENGITKFQFSIQNERPDIFFCLLYFKKGKDREEAIRYLRENGKIDIKSDKYVKGKNTEKQLYKKKAIQAITSLAYCYAADCEGERA